MKKLKLETLKVESFATTAANEKLRGTVAAHEDDATFSNCPESYGGTCVMSVCVGCNSDVTC
jgi:tRNA(His) 5'-end guanylyltransferase